MPVDHNREPPVLGHHQGFDVYPMPLFLRMETGDLAATIRWYREALEFGVMFETPGMAHLRRKKYQDLLLFGSVGGGGPAPGLAISLEAEGEVDSLFARATAAAVTGRSRVEAPQLTPWNARELRVTDPDGRLLVFHEQAKDPEAAARMRTMLETGQR